MNKGNLRVFLLWYSGRMNEWLKLKWKTKRGYISLALTTIALGAIGFFTGDEPLKPEDFGIVLGLVANLIVWYGPVVFVDAKNIKIRRPKEKFVEPTQIIIGLYYILGMVVAVIGGLIVLSLLQLTGVEALMDTEGLVGSAIMAFLLFSVLTMPPAMYMLNAKLRYKRIVEWKTREWKTLHKK